MPAEPDIEVAVLDPAWNSDVPNAPDLCRRAAIAALAAVGRELGAVEVSLALADDALVRRLNREYRGSDKATNVLSFPSEMPGGAPRLLGDVVLARETVLTEARAQHKAGAEHLTHLVVHGCLHLLGYDHEADEEAAEMERLEVGVLAGLGLPNPYLERPDAGEQGR